MVYIGVIGESSCSSEKIANYAYEVGCLLAKKGAVVVCGGMAGVMEQVARGVKDSGGISIGILPTSNRNDANPYITYPISTGIGYARNAIITRTVDGVIAIGGSYGTLSELGFAVSDGKPVIGLCTWRLFKHTGREARDIVYADTPQAALEKLFELLEA